ncbi:MAG TPA: ATP-binding protein, partial [Pseudonocardiaceae bacterium]|nr:ATP-binding protein [Pseudonocardiaceae bacterium]
GTLAYTRRFALEQAARFGLRGDHTEFELIVGELIANSVAHGGGTGTLSVWAEESNLVCEVRDCGHITDPLAGRLPVERHQLSGRGLLLVNHLADLVRQHTGPDGTTMRIHLALPVQPRPPADPSPRTAAGARSSELPPPPDRAPLRWQTDDALRAAARFARYLPVDAPDVGRDVERRHLRPVLEALAAADVLVQVVELWRTRLVKLARRRGARWTEIGRALGVSKQAAHERYGGTRRRGSRVAETGARFEHPLLDEFRAPRPDDPPHSRPENGDPRNN